MNHGLISITEDRQYFIESRVGVTYVFPLDEHQILWWQSAIVARYGNGLSIRGYQASTSMHCNTKKWTRVTIFKHTVRRPPPGTEETHLHCSHSLGQWSNMCSSYLGFCSGEFERIQPIMFQQRCVTVTVGKEALCRQRNGAGIKGFKELVGSTFCADVVSLDD